LPVTIAKGFFPLSFEEGPKEVVMLTDERFREAAAMALEMHLETEQGVCWFLGKPGEGSDASYQRHFPLVAPLTELAGYEVAKQDPYSLINFYGPAGTVARIPLYELVQEMTRTSATEKLAGKVVLVGFQSLTRMRGQLNQEEFTVAVSSEPMFGVEIFAHVAGNLIDNSAVRRLPVEAEAQLLLMLSALLCFIILSQGLWSAWFFSVGLWSLYAIGSYFTFVQKSYFVPGASLLFVVLLALIGPVSLYRAFKERESLQLIRKRLGLGAHA
jgi:CHASE2 domain-containing sensor protein